MWLNVGGVVFETRIDTLGKVNSFFSEFTTYPETKEVFVDRDPTHFRHILNYMRGSLTYPPTRIELVELMNEAAFYSLDDMFDKLKHLLHKCEHDMCYHLEKISTKMS